MVKDDFVCEPQGVVNVKGKGEMEVWYVTGQKNNPAKLIQVLARKYKHQV